MDIGYRASIADGVVVSLSPSVSSIRRTDRMSGPGNAKEPAMRLPTNESAADRLIRIILGGVLVALAVTGIASGVLGIVALVVAAIAIVTAIVGFCPLYAIFRIGTKATSR